MNQANAKADPVELFMQKSGLEEWLKATNANPDEIAGVRQRIATKFKEIAKVAPAEERGTPKIVLGRLSLHVTGSVWPLAKCAVKFIVAYHDPTGITWGFAADQAMETLEKLRESVSLLDSVE